MQEFPLSREFSTSCVSSVPAVEVGELELDVQRSGVWNTTLGLLIRVLVERNSGTATCATDVKSK